MIRPVRRIGLALIAASLLGSAAARAQSLAGKVMVYGNLGYGAYCMRDANHFIDEQNELIRATGGDTMNHIGSGLNAGGGVGVWLADYLAVGAEGNYLDAGTTGKLGLLGTSTRVSLPGVEAIGFIRLGIPVSDRLWLGVTGGVGNYWAKGQTEFFRNKVDYEGYHFGGKATGSLEVFLLPAALSLGVDVGYRFISIPELKDKNGRVLKTVAGDTVTVNYSGLVLLGSLRVYF